MRANCTSIAGVHSALAPASSITVGQSRSRSGIGVAIAGRITPGSRPMRSSADAIVAPVLPAETIAIALPSRTASAARTSDASFLRRTPCAGSSSMPMTSPASMTGRSPTSPMRSRRADQHHRDAPLLGDLLRPGDDLLRRLVAAHRVDGHRQGGEGRAGRSCGAPCH